MRCYIMYCTLSHVQEPLGAISIIANLSEAEPAVFVYLLGRVLNRVNTTQSQLLTQLVEVNIARPSVHNGIQFIVLYSTKGVSGRK